MGTSSARRAPTTRLWRRAKGLATRYLAPAGGTGPEAREVVAGYLAALGEDAGPGSQGLLSGFRLTRKVALDLGAFSQWAANQGWKTALAEWGLTAAGGQPRQDEGLALAGALLEPDGGLEGAVARSSLAAVLQDLDASTRDNPALLVTRFLAESLYQRLALDLGKPLEAAGRSFAHWRQGLDGLKRCIAGAAAEPENPPSAEQWGRLSGWAWVTMTLEKMLQHLSELPASETPRSINEETADHLYLRAPGEKRRAPPGPQAVIHLDEAEVQGYPVHHNLEALFSHPTPPSPGVAAFLMAALGVWAGDKLLPRSFRPDAWTREIVLHLPTAPAWAGLSPRLARVLNFLTGDNWTIKLRESPLDSGFAGKWDQPWQPQAVALFSGGLDSLAGVIDLLEAGQRLLLVSHHDYGQLAAAQQTLAGALASHYGPERVHHLNLRVQFPEAPELTLRSRSLLYLALGLTAAAAFGPEMPLYIPENGWVSLNPPLTLNRLGSCTTRTTHPYFLDQIRWLWRDAGIRHPLTNPYQHLTKGEALGRCRNRELLKQLAPDSSSCARPVASRWRRQRGGECGYCYPCLIRRAALHRLGWDRGGDYLLDAPAAPETLQHRVQGRDLRALLLALRTWEEAPGEVENRVYWGVPGADSPRKYAATRQLLASGFQEIGQFFRDKGCAGVKAYGGW